MLQISAQYGDPRSRDMIRPIHLEANRAFSAHMTRRYFRTLQKLTIVLRVCGTIWTFDGEGPDRLKYLRSKNEITIDLVVPQDEWQGASQNRLRRYFVRQLRECFSVLCERAKDEAELTDVAALAEDFEKAVDMLINV